MNMKSIAVKVKPKQVSPSSLNTESKQQNFGQPVRHRSNPACNSTEQRKRSVPDNRCSPHNSKVSK